MTELQKRYTGNKKIPGVYQKIINHIPQHSYYCELFAGSGAIGKLLPATTVKHFNDIDCTLHGHYSLSDNSTLCITAINAPELVQFLSIYVGAANTFIFADPPYLHCTRAQSDYYKYEMSDSDHIQFLSAVQQSPCQIMIIHPACELYDQALQSWNQVEIKIRYNRKTSIEKLYMNYSPRSLQSYKYIGKDCWQRQAYKRKAIRHSHKSILLPFPEVQYLIDPLN